MMMVLFLGGVHGKKTGQFGGYVSFKTLMNQVRIFCDYFSFRLGREGGGAQTFSTQYDTSDISDDKMVMFKKRKQRKQLTEAIMWRHFP